MDRVWFTSDLHFSHTNIAGPKVSRWKGGYRDFHGTHQMNAALTDSINRWVGEGDVLYFLGDWCLGSHRRTPEYREWIACRTIHFIRGNHDRSIDLYAGCFSSLSDDMEVELGGERLYLAHRPLDDWPGRAGGATHLFGHTHNTHEGRGRSMDVGVDAARARLGEYRPFSLAEVLDITKSKPSI